MSEKKEDFDWYIDFLEKHGYLKDFGDKIEATKKLEDAFMAVGEEMKTRCDALITHWALLVAYKILNDTKVGILAKRELGMLASILKAFIGYQAMTRIGTRLISDTFDR